MRSSNNNKNKWISALFSLIFPGLGHFYIGVMQKGLLFVALFVLDIVGIVYFSMRIALNGSNILLVIVCSLFVPVIYFYSLFDSFHILSRMKADTEAFDRQTDSQSSVFDHNADTFHPSKSDRFPIGVLLLVGAAFFLLLKDRISIVFDIIHSIESYVVGFLLIGIGVAIYIKDK